MINFDQEMRKIPSFREVIEQGRIEIEGETFPVLQFEVVPDID